MGWYLINNYNKYKKSKMDVLTIARIMALGCLVGGTFAETSSKTKRQIYREQVLPFRGGKVPEGAFRADRLALNRLNKEGIAVPDGILLEHRNVHNHPHVVRHDPEDENSVIRVIQQADNRYVPDEGRYHNDNHATVASTYIIRRPIEAEQTNIRTPDQQRPLHEYLNYKQHGGDQQHKVPYEPHPLPVHRQPPKPPAPPKINRYEIPQQPDYHPQIYHAIPVPFELPNREIQDEDYLPKPHALEAAASTSKLDWPFQTEHFDRFNFDLNSLLPTSDFDFNPAAFRFYESEPIPVYHGHYDFFDGRGRFLRKTPESYMKGTIPAGREEKRGSHNKQRQEP